MPNKRTDEQRRNALWGRGWKYKGGTIRGVLLWRDPVTEGLYEEQDAFRMLEEMEAKEKVEVKNG